MYLCMSSELCSNILYALGCLLWLLLAFPATCSYRVDISNFDLILHSLHRKANSCVCLHPNRISVGIMLITVVRKIHSPTEAEQWVGYGSPWYMPPEEGIEVNPAHISLRPSASYVCFNASEFSKILFKDFPLKFSPFTFCHWTGRNFTSLPKQEANCQDITKILYWVLVQPWHYNPMPGPFSKEAPTLRGFQDPSLPHSSESDIWEPKSLDLAYDSVQCHLESLLSVLPFLESLVFSLPTNSKTKFKARAGRCMNTQEEITALENIVGATNIPLHRTCSVVS